MGLLVAWAAVQPAAADPAADPGDDRPADPVVEVTIDSFTPSTPRPDQPVTITGRITNTSDATFTNTQAAACVDDARLTSREQLAAIRTQADQPVGDRTDCVGLNNSASTSFQEFATPLAPRASVPFRLVVPWQDWGVGDRAGVYTVGVRFRGDVTRPGQDGDQGTERISAGLSRTLMPVVGTEPPARRVNTALVVPLQHRPTLLSGSRFANDSLARALAPTGRLGRLLALGQRRQVTWLVDPATIDEIRQLAAGYRVVDGPLEQNRTVPGTGQALAQSWLSAFTANRARNPVVLLPYGDPDVAGLLDAGSPLRELVGRARTATERFNLGGAQYFRSGLWLDNGSATSRNLAAASTGYAGAKADDVTLVPSSAWPAATRPDRPGSPAYDVVTPEGPVQTVRTLVADSTLTAGGPDPDTATDPVQLRQRFAAETSLLAATGRGTTTVIALPPRGSDPDGRGTVALADGLSLPWVTPVSLDAVAGKPGTTPAAAPRAVAPAGPRTTPGLTANQLQEIRSLGDATTTFVSLLSDPDAADENLGRALLRSASTSWRGFADEARRFAGYELAAVNGQLGRVHLVTNPGSGRREIRVNLSGSKGTFPLTIANELPVSVRVGVVVTSANRTDLRIEPLETRILAAGQKATYQIDASAEQNGLIRADAQVISAQQLPVGSSRELVIQAAQYGSTGWILVGAAVALLFGTSAVRIYRRVRSERGAPAAVATGDPLHPEPLPPEATGAEPPADPLDPPDEAPVPGRPDQLKEGVGTKDG